MKVCDFKNSTVGIFRCSSFRFIKDYVKNMHRNSCIEIRSIGNNKIFFKDFENFFIQNYRLEKIRERFYVVYLNDIKLGYMKNNCQFFIIIKKLDFCKEFFDFLEKQLHVKTCYSINSRFFDEEKQDINGGYDSVRFVNYLQFDVEEKSKTKPSKAKDEMFAEYLAHLQRIMNDYGLCFKYVMNSGNGRHVICEVQRTAIDEERRNWYNEFFRHLLMKCEDCVFKIDEVKDFTRVFGLPGTINPKWNKYIKVLCYEDRVSDMRIKKKKLKVVLNENQERVHFPESITRIEDTLEHQIIIKNPPEGEMTRHHHIAFPYKMLLRDLEVEDWKSYARILERSFGRPDNLNPKSLSDKNQYSLGIIINWAKANDAWCKENGIDYEDYIKKFNKRIQDD